jgi:hypothetical protein
MRTTVTLDPDVEALLRRAMKEKGLTFKEALNNALRAGLLAGLGGRKTAPVTLPTRRMGKPLVDLRKTLQLAAEMEDAEILRKLELGK